MAAATGEMIIVTGATGLQGRAVCRHLIDAGWRVRGLTRNRASKQAQALATMGVEIMQGNMEDPDSLIPIFSGAYGVYSVQNPFIAGVEAEVQQGKICADVARASAVQHLVFGSAGTGRKGTNIPSWESKLLIEEHIKACGLPHTILRPTAFMELMTDQKFFPAVGTWQVMWKLMGSTRRLPWLSTDDLGAIAARIFAAPHLYIGTDITLASDVQSLEQCRDLYREVLGKYPQRFPMPIWLFSRFGFVGRDLTTMWRWLRTGTVDLDTSRTYAIYPHALTVRDWLGKVKAART